MKTDAGASHHPVSSTAPPETFFDNPEIGVQELTSMAELAARAPGCPYLRWVARAFGAGVRGWSAGDAVAIACPGLWRHDLLAVAGPAPAAEQVVKHALAMVGPEFRPFGTTGLITELAERVDELAVENEYHWMDTTEQVPDIFANDSTDGAGATGDFTGGAAHWLTDEEIPEAIQLVGNVIPTPYARPGMSGVERWAGVRDESGHLTAVAADAWSAPSVGFLSGFAVSWESTDAQAPAVAATSLVIDSLVASHGRAALIVDAWDLPAIRRYEQLGLRGTPLATAIAS